jgi:hypothetical protein
MHALVLDGVFAHDAGGRLSFHPLSRLTGDDVLAVVATIERRITRLLARRGLANEGVAESAPDAWAEQAPVLAGIAAASVQGTLALGSRTGARPGRYGDLPEAVDPPTRGRHHAHTLGFDLHAGIVVRAGQRERLERLCRYALRPPVAQDRLRLTDEGRVLFGLRHRWADGTTHLVFDPTELLARLAAVIPRPRINLVLYYGLLAPRATWRAEVVPRRPADLAEPTEGSPVRPQAAAPGERVADRPSNLLWADLMRRSFGFDVLACATCGGRLQLVALIQDPRVIERILRHLDLPTEIAQLRPPRAPPMLESRRPPAVDDDVAVHEPCS